MKHTKSTFLDVSFCFYISDKESILCLLFGIPYRCIIQVKCKINLNINMKCLLWDIA